MGIPSVTDSTSAPAIPVSVAASTVAPTEQKKQAAPVAQPITTPEPPPPPPPVEGFPFDVSVGEHAGTGHMVYGFVDPESGETVVQIPAPAVLDLVAMIISKLKAEGLR